PRVLGDRKRDREHRAMAAGAIGSCDRSAHRLDEAAANGQPEAGTGAMGVAGLSPVELVEDMLQVAGGNARPFIFDRDAHQSAVAPRAYDDARTGRRV